MQIPGYDDVALIAHGGFATVFRARQVAFERDVAVKVLTVELDEVRDRTRFQREVAAMGRLTGHPHIVTILDSGFTPDGRPYLTTPYYPQGSLGQQLASSGPFAVREVLDIGVAMAGALDAAHQRGTGADGPPGPTMGMIGTSPPAFGGAVSAASARRSTTDSVRSSETGNPSSRWMSCNARPNAAAGRMRASGAFAIAASSARSSDAGTSDRPIGGTGSVFTRITRGISPSSAGPPNGVRPARSIHSDDASEYTSDASVARPPSSTSGGAWPRVKACVVWVVDPRPGPASVAMPKSVSAASP